MEYLRIRGRDTGAAGIVLSPVEAAARVAGQEGGLDEPCRIKILSIKARSYKLQSYNAEYNLIKQDKYKLEWIIIERNDYGI